MTQKPGLVIRIGDIGSKDMSCRGICIQHRAQVRLGGRYANGQKRCQVCQIYMKWDGLRCPCCGCKVRSRPRNSKSKKELEVTRKTAISKIKIKNDNLF